MSAGSIGAICGLLYGSVLAIVAIFAAGGGHGTAIPLWLSSAPIGVFGLLAWHSGDSQFAGTAMLLGPPIVWATLGSLASLPRARRLTQVLLLLQYASGLALVVAADAELADLARNAWVIVYVVVWAAVYLGGQIPLWWRITRHDPPLPSG